MRTQVAACVGLAMVVALGASLAGCSDDGASPRADAGTTGLDAGASPDAGAKVPNAYASYCHSLGEAICAAHLRCGAMDEAQRLDCLARQRSDLGCIDPLLGDSIAEGRLVFQEEESKACLALWTATGCDVVRMPALAAATCGKVLRRTVTKGGECNAYQDLGVDDCADGLRCEGEACARTCVAREEAARGQPCGSKPCSGDDWCKPDPASADAGSEDFGTCAAPLAKDEACGDGPASCASGLYCSSETSTCQAQVAVGDACAEHEQCPFLLCASAKCAAGEAALGEVCGPSVRCRESFCKPGTDPSTGFCTAFSKKDEPCDPTWAKGACDTGLFCDSTEVCVELPSESQPCAGEGACKSFLLCQEGTCVALPQQGQACGEDGNRSIPVWPTCKPGLRCDVESLTCQAPRESGACMFDGDCASKHCSFGECDPVCP